MYQLTASIVLYKPTESIICTIESFLRVDQLETSLYLIDNSPTNEFQKKNKQLLENKKIKYIFLGKNIGYGAAHNMALKKTVNQSLYHLVLNPDVEFKAGTLENIFQFMQLYTDVGHLMPKVFYKNGDIQKLCNPLPKPFNLIGRRFFGNAEWAKKINDGYELDGFNYDRCLNVPNLSGCFMFLRCNTLKQVGFFDERYFMYMEDVDLCRRIHAVSKTIFYPVVNIIHGFEKESYSSKKLLKYHIQSAIKYFNKWGWIYDKQRDKFNESVLNLITSGNYNTFEKV